MIAVLRLAGAAVLVLSMAAGRLPAQERQRSKLWIELGAGPGVGIISCSNCDRTLSTAGASSTFRIGGTISEKVLLGFDNFSFINQAFGLDDEEGNIVAETSTAALSALWYPNRSGWFFKGGVGIAYGNFTVDAVDSDPVVASEVGLGLTFGIGYDRPLSRRLSFTVNAGALIAAIGDVVLLNSRVDDVIASLYQLTVGITVR